MCRTKSDGGNLNGVARIDVMRIMDHGIIAFSVATLVMGKLKDSGYYFTTNTIFIK